LALRVKHLHKTPLSEYNPIYNEIIVDTFRLQNQNFDQFLSEIKKFNIRYIHAYPLLLKEFMEDLRQRNRHFHVNGIMLGSEGATPEELVGINGDKNWLPHHTEGSPANGGDEFPDDLIAHAVERRLKRVGRRMALSMPGIGGLVYRKMRNAGKMMLGDSETVIRNGNWHGNDTCWRMVLDLNRALLYGNMDGTWREAGQSKNYLTIVDGIVGGEGNGPLCPKPVKSNVLITGTDPAGVDAVAARLMGYDPLNIPLIREAFADHRWPVSFCGMDDLMVYDARAGKTVGLNYVKPALDRAFKPHFGWTNLTELNSDG
jgi:hypothetical protein